MPPHPRPAANAARNVRIERRLDGRVYYYHRPTKTRLPGAPGEAGFEATLTRLNAGWAPEAALKPCIESSLGLLLTAPCKPVDVATLGDLIRAYRASPAWNEKAPSTRRQYQKAIDYLAQIDATPLAQIDSPWAIRLRDIVLSQRKRRFANLILQIVSLLWNWGRPYGYTQTDSPTATVPKVRRPRGLPQANRPWSVDEFHAFLDAAPPALRVAAALGGYAGLREADILRATWAWYDGQKLQDRAQKTGEIIDIRAHLELRSILDAERRSRNVPLGHASPLVQSSKTGERFTESGFRASFFKLLRKLEAAGTVKPGLTVHGLRHTAATMLADAGCSTREIMAITGHKTEAMVKLYTEGADRRRSADAAIDRMERFTGERG